MINIRTTIRNSSPIIFAIFASVAQVGASAASPDLKKISEQLERANSIIEQQKNKNLLLSTKLRTANTTIKSMSISGANVRALKTELSTAYDTISLNKKINNRTTISLINVHRITVASLKVRINDLEQNLGNSLYDKTKPVKNNDSLRKANAQILALRSKLDAAQKNQAKNNLELQISSAKVLDTFKQDEVVLMDKQAQLQQDIDSRNLEISELYAKLENISEKLISNRDTILLQHKGKIQALQDSISGLKGLIFNINFKQSSN